METNALITNNVGYVGSVKITYKDRGHKHSVYLHNEGTQYLGNLISIALAGDSRNIDSIRNRCASAISFEVKMSENEWRTLISGTSPITSSVWGEAVGTIEDSKFNDNPNVIGRNRFSSIMSTGLVIRGYGTTVQNQDLRLRLINNRNEDLAYIYDLASSEDRDLPMLYTALENGQDALIDWTMYILNHVSSSTEGGN